MWQIIIAVGILAAEFVYHRWIDPPPKPTPTKDVTIPLTAEGSTIPLIYGRCRVQAPILAYCGSPVFAYTGDEDQIIQYGIDMFFVLGIPCWLGSCGIYNVWSGDALFANNKDLGTGDVLGDQYVGLADLVGDGNFENTTPSPGRIAQIYTTAYPGDPVDHPFLNAGAVELLNGNPDQQLVDPSPTTIAGELMTTTTSADPDPMKNLNGVTNPLLIPGYRGYLSAMLWNQLDVVHWNLNGDPNINAYSFEVKSWPSGLGSGLIGYDMNPADIIYDLLAGKFGKLGIDPTLIDSASFTAAATTLADEGHGMSRAFEATMTFEEILKEICAQIAAVVFEDPSTGKIKIRLIRPDYDPETCFVISPANCVRLESFAASGWTDIPNRVLVAFKDRQKDYKDGTGKAENQSNMVGQDDEIREVQLQYPGICSQALADEVASRELQARAQPMMKCSAIMNRSAVRLLPGDVVMLTWPEAHLDRVAMRVAGSGRGTLASGQIKLDLVKDSFYQWRRLRPEPPPHIGLGDTTILGG